MHDLSTMRFIKIWGGACLSNPVIRVQWYTVYTDILFNLRLSLITFLLVACLSSCSSEYCSPLRESELNLNHSISLWSGKLLNSRVLCGVTAEMNGLHEKRVQKICCTAPIRNALFGSAPLCHVLYSEAARVARSA